MCAGRWRRAQGVEVECTAGTAGKMAACASPATAPSAVRGVYPEGMAFVRPLKRAAHVRTAVPEVLAESENEMLSQLDSTSGGY